MTNIKINFSLEALRAKRAELARIQLREYETRGNTQRCQELWEKITKLDEEIERRESSMEKRIKGKVAVTRDQIDCWNRMSEAVKGTGNYYAFALCHEYRDTSGHWHYLSHGSIRAHMLEHVGEEFYIRQIRDTLWLYWEDRGDFERWCLSDLAMAFFNV